ncbi:MAG: hypothetical protein HYX48_01125 [Chlamydiales bacterium]|nr:hypothetical protein [Chlamydiales bacterium]
MTTSLPPVHGQKPAAIAADGKSIDTKGSGSRAPQPDTLTPHPDHETGASCFGYIEACCCNIFTYIAGLAISAYDWICEMCGCAPAKEVSDPYADLTLEQLTAKRWSRIDAIVDEWETGKVFDQLLRGMPLPCKLCTLVRLTKHEFQNHSAPHMFHHTFSSSEEIRTCDFNLKDTFSSNKASLEGALTTLKKASGDREIGGALLAVIVSHKLGNGKWQVNYAAKMIDANGKTTLNQSFISHAEGDEFVLDDLLFKSLGIPKRNEATVQVALH